MQIWLQRALAVKALPTVWLDRAKRRLDEQTRPTGSLGVLETLIQKLVAIQHREKPDVTKKRIFVFAADHGVEVEGVSAYPRSVTAAMVMNFVQGGATISALARQIQAEVRVFDVGVDADLTKGSPGSPLLVHAKVRRGTRNMREEAAMTPEELDRALSIGWDAVHQARVDKVDLIGLGEMGIANTTAASCVVAALLGLNPITVVGRGTGINPEGLERKTRVIQEALQLHSESIDNPLEVLRCLGGFEIAAMTGAILAGGCLGMPLVVDGWVVGAAVLVAYRMNPLVLDYLFFGHESEEKGHRLLLEALGARAILKLSMRLGEASGAALAMGILEAGVRVYNEVATFQEAQVAGKSAEEKANSLS